MQVLRITQSYVKISIFINPFWGRRVSSSLILRLDKTNTILGNYIKCFIYTNLEAGPSPIRHDGVVALQSSMIFVPPRTKTRTHTHTQRNTHLLQAAQKVRLR